MLMGLKKGQAKMSKSDPESAIFMEDSVKDVNRKIKGSFCPEGEVKDNPILDYTKHIIFAKFDTLTVTRDEANGGDSVYTSYEELEAAYVAGAIHPGDLKPAIAKAINEILEPVRQHFKTNQVAKQLLATIKKYKVTR
jgi:tyrosyl-tRNA synthetase